MNAAVVFSWHVIFGLVGNTLFVLKGISIVVERCHVEQRLGRDLRALQKGVSDW